MKFCENCGCQVDDSAISCMRCGHVTGKLYCSNCKKELKKDSVFCEYCGTKVPKAEVKTQSEKKHDEEFKPSKIKSVLALIFAIGALVAGTYAATPYCAISGLISMVVWYCLSAKMRDSYVNEMNQPENGLTKASKIISVISIPICIIACIVSFVLTISMGDEILEILNY